MTIKRAARSGTRILGQSLVEFLVSLVFVAVAIGGVMSLLYSQWNRMRCAYLVFEATHARLVHTRWTRPSFTGSARVYFEENETEVSGRAKCGAASETVTLKRLEEGSW